MTAYYNEIDAYPTAWLSRLADAGHIAPGTVDARSIREVQPRDLDGYAQCHFFAGIGAWSYALRLAGWPDALPVWTGSCPCQPFSAAGKRGGFSDERHLWPEWFRLIRECRPPVVFGEQVASGDGLRWFDAVSADLEGAGYAVGAADLCAAGVGAPHIRQRLWFMAYCDGRRCEGACISAQLRDESTESDPRWGRAPSGMGDADSEHARRDSGAIPGTEDPSRREWRTDGGVSDLAGASSRARNPWSGAEWLPCLDGKTRPVEPGTFPLAHGTPGRVGRLRAYGNAIVPQVAATFIRAAAGAIFK